MVDTRLAGSSSMASNRIDSLAIHHLAGRRLPGGSLAVAGAREGAHRLLPADGLAGVLVGGLVDEVAFGIEDCCLGDTQVQCRRISLGCPLS